MKPWIYIFITTEKLNFAKMSVMTLLHSHDEIVMDILENYIVFSIVLKCKYCHTKHIEKRADGTLCSVPSARIGQSSYGYHLYCGWKNAGSGGVRNLVKRHNLPIWQHITVYLTYMKFPQPLGQIFYKYMLYGHPNNSDFINLWNTSLREFPTN